MKFVTNLSSSVKKLLQGAAAALALFIVVGWVGLEEATAAMVSADPAWIFFMTLLMIAGWFVGAIKMIVYVRALDQRVPMFFVFRSYLRSVSLGMLAPGKMGELTFPHYLSKAGLSYGVGLAFLVVDKGQMFVLSLLAASAGVFVYVGRRQAAAALVFGLLFVAIASLALFSKRIRRLVRKRVLGEKDTCFQGFAGTLTALCRERYLLFSFNLVLTAVRMLVQAAGVCAGFEGFQTQVGLLPTVAVIAVIQMVSWVPVTISGLGLVHGSAVLLFSVFLGLAKAVVLDVFLLVTLIGYLIAFAVLGLLGFRSEPAFASEKAK